MQFYTFQTETADFQIFSKEQQTIILPKNPTIFQLPHLPNIIRFYQQLLARLQHDLPTPFISISHSNILPQRSLLPDDLCAAALEIGRVVQAFSLIEPSWVGQLHPNLLRRTEKGVIFLYLPIHTASSKVEADLIPSLLNCLRTHALDDSAPFQLLFRKLSTCNSLVNFLEETAYFRQVYAAPRLSRQLVSPKMRPRKSIHLFSSRLNKSSSRLNKSSSRLFSDRRNSISTLPINLSRSLRPQSLSQTVVSKTKLSQNCSPRDKSQRSSCLKYTGNRVQVSNDSQSLLLKRMNARRQQKESKQRKIGGDGIQFKAISCVREEQGRLQEGIQIQGSKQQEQRAHTEATVSKIDPTVEREQLNTVQPTTVEIEESSIKEIESIKPTSRKKKSMQNSSTIKGTRKASSNKLAGIGEQEAEVVEVSGDTESSLREELANLDLVGLAVVNTPTHLKNYEKILWQLPMYFLYRVFSHYRSSIARRAARCGAHQLAQELDLENLGIQQAVQRLLRLVERRLKKQNPSSLAEMSPYLQESANFQPIMDRLLGEYVVCLSEATPHEPDLLQHQMELIDALVVMRSGKIDMQERQKATRNPLAYTLRQKGKLC